MLGAMAEYKVGAPVVTRGVRVVGIFSEREYASGVEVAGCSSRATQVRNVVISEPPEVSPQPGIPTCMTLMSNHRVRHLPGSWGDEPVGLVSIGDLVAAMIRGQAKDIAHLERYNASG